MSRALRLVVTQSKCERLVIPNILQSYSKIHGVSAVVVFTKKSCGVRIHVEKPLSYGHVESEKLSGSEFIFWTRADAKIVLSKMLYRCDSVQKEVRKIRD